MLYNNREMIKETRNKTDKNFKGRIRGRYKIAVQITADIEESNEQIIETEDSMFAELTTDDLIIEYHNTYNGIVVESEDLLFRELTMKDLIVENDTTCEEI
jgi:hypothetical protein